MQEDNMKSYAEFSENLRKEGNKLFNIVKNNPNGYEAIQNQYKEIIGKQTTYNPGLQRLHDRSQGKTLLINHIKQREIDFIRRYAYFKIYLVLICVPLHNIIFLVINKQAC